MRASAQLAVVREESGGSVTGPTRISRLHSEPPLALRPVHLTGVDGLRSWGLSGPSIARVALVAGAGGPIGGDQLKLGVDVGPGAALVLRAVSATVVLPGPHGLPSHSHVTIRVGTNGTLVWLPGPVIAASGCDHHAATHIELEPGARLLIREELVLGRHGEAPGWVRQRLRVTLAARPLHDQELHLGPDAPGWDGPAVTGRRQALGSILVVNPDWSPSGAPGPPAAAVDTDTARLPLQGPAVLLTALAPDALTLRHRLNAALTELESLTCRAARI